MRSSTAVATLMQMTKVGGWFGLERVGLGPLLVRDLCQMLVYTDAHAHCFTSGMVV